VWNSLWQRPSKQWKLVTTTLDLRYVPLCQDILTMLARASALSALQYDASLLQRTSYLLWIAHLLNQMGNHATNIGKQIIFIEEGEDKII
jgi:phosphate uptake regulator